MVKDSPSSQRRIPVLPALEPLQTPLLQPSHPSVSSQDDAASKRSGVVTEVHRPPTVTSNRLGGTLDDGSTLSRRAHMVSLVVNTALLFGKGYVYYRSGSMAVLASLVDSAVDMLAQGALMAANRLTTDDSPDARVHYPAGRSRLEPVGVVACALLMGMASAQVIRDAVHEMWQAAATGQPNFIEVTQLDGYVMAVTIVSKAVLYVWCKWIFDRTGNLTVEAAAQDNMNDVISNAAALAAALLTQVKRWLWLSDPIGAVLISGYIIYSWAKTGQEQIDLLIGRSAEPEFLDVVREMAETHDPAASLDMVRAYHFGQCFLVEVELVMAEDTALRESHDCGIHLQHKIEALEQVERCFVHIDYQHRDVDDHDPSIPLGYKTIDAQSLPSLPEGSYSPRRSDCRSDFSSPRHAV